MRLLSIIAILLAIIFPTPTFAEMKEEDGMISLWSKGAGWMLQFPGEGYQLKTERHEKDGLSHYYFFVNSNLNLNVSFFIEPMRKCTSSEECRTQYWKNPEPTRVNPQEVNFFELNGFLIVEFLVPTFKGIQVDQMNMSAHHVREGYWVDLHISKVLYQPKDRAMFLEFIKAIRFEEKR